MPGMAVDPNRDNELRECDDTYGPAGRRAVPSRAIYFDCELGRVKYIPLSYTVDEWEGLHMGDMWLTDRTCEYDGWDGKPPNRIHFVSPVGHFEYAPVETDEAKRNLVGLDAENIRLRVVAMCLMDFFLRGSCAVCSYASECKAAHASEDCKLMGELRALGIKSDDWR